MAALLVGLSIMAIALTVVMPVWKQAAQREKETELVFRGQQWARAIGLFQRKYANAFPPNLDVLVEQRFVRRKYKDPITGDDFQPLLQSQGSTPGGGTQTSQRPGSVPAAGTASQPSTGRGAQPGVGPAGGIIGVASKSKDTSIRLYNGRSHYNEWAFVFVQQTQAPGVGGAPGGAPRGNRPGQPGQGNQPGQSQTPGPGGFRPGGGGQQPPTGPRGPGGAGGRGGPGRQGGFDPLVSTPQQPPRRPF
jgi:type II secretory pathway pseudopilin PulG